MLYVTNNKWHMIMFLRVEGQQWQRRTLLYESI